MCGCTSYSANRYFAAFDLVPLGASDTRPVNRHGGGAGNDVDLSGVMSSTTSSGCWPNAFVDPESGASPDPHFDKVEQKAVRRRSCMLSDAGRVGFSVYFVAL